VPAFLVRPRSVGPLLPVPSMPFDCRHLLAVRSRRGDVGLSGMPAAPPVSRPFRAAAAHLRPAEPTSWTSLSSDTAPRLAQPRHGAILHAMQNGCSCRQSARRSEGRESGFAGDVSYDLRRGEQVIPGERPGEAPTCLCRHRRAGPSRPAHERRAVRRLTGNQRGPVVEPGLFTLFAISHPRVRIGGACSRCVTLSRECRWLRVADAVPAGAGEGGRSYARARPPGRGRLGAPVVLGFAGRRSPDGRRL